MVTMFYIVTMMTTIISAIKIEIFINVLKNL